MILKRCGIALDQRQLERLWRYHQMLRKANVELNLTRIHKFESMVLKHYVDSLLVLEYLELPAPLVDMGSGAGLPGIPLKIARPALPMILAEPRGARASFLREVCERLGLENVDVYGHKLGPDFPGQVGGVISRAVGPIPATLDRVKACLSAGSRMIFMKGPECEGEVVEATASHAGSFRLALDRAYTIPGTPFHRRLVVFERLADDPLGQAGSPSQRLRTRTAPAFTGTVREITSESNTTFQRCRDLLTGAGVRKHKEAILAGDRIRAEVLARFPEHVLAWLTGPDGPPPPHKSITWFCLSVPLLKQLDVVGTHSPLLLVSVPPIVPWSDNDPWPDGCTLFVPFQDPENVGAVIRSAAAFGAARIVLLREAAHPFHPRASRAAGPALFQVPILRGPSLQSLSVKDRPLIALDPTGPEIGETPFPDSFGLVVGAEGPGLPIPLRHGERRRITMQPGVESLNAATAAAIALYVWARSRGPRAPDA
jgi:16S rRNA (guanine527-N7)-methyltransferase